MGAILSLEQVRKALDLKVWLLNGGPPFLLGFKRETRKNRPFWGGHSF